MKYSFIFLITFLLISSGLVSAFGASVSIPEKYGFVQPGERLYFEVSVKYPENPSRVDLNFGYTVTQNGEIVVKAKTIKAIETQMSFIDYVSIPEFADSGMSSIVISIDDFAELNQEVDTTFFISEGESNNVTLYFFIIGAVALLVGVLVGIDLVVHRRLLFANATV
ncbi:MAG: hypothetical protein ACI83O_000949 [Patescibacteria group bacterium]|jgi:hypothetical protein